MSYLSLRRVAHSYGGKVVLDNISIDIERGEFVSLLGPSGCGKTTTLRLIAGYEETREGTITLNGSLLNGLPAYKRDMGMVFQSYALFPHMTVLGNVLYGLRQRKLPRAEARERATATLDLVQLPGYHDRYPRQLSGGQQQRVALARALVIEPALLLLDESLSALDRKLRVEMQVELRRIQQEVGITTLFVTHDQEEALTLSDRIALMRDGKVVQCDRPREIYEKPADAFVAGFLGQANFFSGPVSRDGEDWTMTLQGGESLRFSAPERLASGPRLSMAVRPEKMSLSPKAGKATPNAGRITTVTYAGGITQYRFEGCGQEWTAQAQNDHVGGERFTEGGAVYFGWPGENTLIFSDEESGS